MQMYQMNDFVCECALSVGGMRKMPPSHTSHVSRIRFEKKMAALDETKILKIQTT